MTTKKKEGEFVTVYTRLYRRDVEVIKQRAEARGFRWQAYLRALIHSALKPGSGPKVD